MAIMCICSFSAPTMLRHGDLMTWPIPHLDTFHSPPPPGQDLCIDLHACGWLKFLPFLTLSLHCFPPSIHQDVDFTVFAKVLGGLWGVSWVVLGCMTFSRHSHSGLESLHVWQLPYRQISKYWCQKYDNSLPCPASFWSLNCRHVIIQHFTMGWQQSILLLGISHSNKTQWFQNFPSTCPVLVIKAWRETWETFPHMATNWTGNTEEIGQS